MPYIYKITSPSGKVYIGSTIDVKKRWDKYNRMNCRQQTRLYASFNKYGVGKHIFDVICETSFENMLSTEYIIGMQYDVLSKNGLNCNLPSLFANSKIVSECSKQRMSVGAKKRFSSEVERQKNRLRGIDKFKDPQKALNHSNGQKKRFSNIEHLEAHRQRAIKRSNTAEFKEKARLITIKQFANQENRDKARQKTLDWYAKGNIAGNSKIVLDTQYGIFYESCIEAAKVAGVKTKTLANKLGGFKRNNTSLIYA